MSILKHPRNLDLNLTCVNLALVEDWLIATTRGHFLIVGYSCFPFL